MLFYDYMHLQAISRHTLLHAKFPTDQLLHLTLSVSIECRTPRGCE